MDGGLKEKRTENGPYRATKLWNNAVHQFKKNMPTGRHRRNMRVYEDCFVASDAVDWLHDYLLKNQDFGENVTRYQTIQLLQKFEKTKVFEDVRNSKNKEVFQDNGRLYRFVTGLNGSPRKRAPLTEKKDSHSVNVLSTLQTSLSTPRKPRNELKIRPSSEGIKKMPPCKPIEKSLSKEQIEKVWKTVSLARLQKLLGKVSVQDIVDANDIHPNNIIHNATFIGKNGIVTNIPKMEHLPPWIMSAMRCLAHWPETVEENLPSYPGFEKDVFRVVKDHFQNLDEPLITYELYDIFYNVFLHADDPSPWRSTPRHPMGMSNDSFLSMENLMTSLASPRTLSNLNLSCIVNLDGHSHMDQSFNSLQSLNKSEPSIQETMYVTAHDETYYDNFAFEGSDRSSSSSLRRYYSSSNLNEALHYLSNGQDNLGSRTPNPCRPPPRYREPPPYCKSLQRTASNASQRRSFQSSRSNSYTESLCRPNRASNSVDKIIDLLQICCLFLPPANRRKLHLLLRLMDKMSHNEKINLGTGVSMKTTLLKTFYRSIFLCIDESCYDEKTGIQLTAFLMDHHERIMTVPPRLRLNVESRVTDMQRIQIRYGPQSPLEVAFCQRLTLQEIEQQKLTNSEEALFELLETIVQNEKMTEKEKKRRLKQFQKVYPDIYAKRFPEEADEGRSKNKAILQGMSGALTKLKSIRF